MVDFADLAIKADEGAGMQVVHPVKGLIEGMTIRLLGTDSEVFHEAQREIINTRMKRAMKKNRINAPMDADEADEAAVSLLVKLTVGWTGFMMGGVEYPCTPENARTIYADPKFAWLREQADEFVRGRENFFGN